MTAEEPTANAATDLVCVGVVGRARGLRGEVRIKSFTADPAHIAAYGSLYDESGGRALRLRVTGRSRDQVVVRIEGVADRQAAQALKGLRLYVPRRVLPQPEAEEYYHVDLIGLRVELAGNGVLGTVKAVHDFGAGDILEIAGHGKEVLMVPFTRAAVPEVNFAAGRLVVDPPPGLLATAADDGTTDEA